MLSQTLVVFAAVIGHGVSIGDEGSSSNTGEATNAERDAASLFDAQIANLEAISSFDVIYQNAQILQRVEKPVVAVTETVRVIYSPETDFAMTVLSVDSRTDTPETLEAYHSPIEAWTTEFGRPSLVVYLYHSGRSMTWNVGLKQQTYPPKTLDEFEKYGHVLDLRWIGFERFPIWSSVPAEVRERVLLNNRFRVASANITFSDNNALVHQHRRGEAQFEYWMKSTHRFDLEQNLVTKHRKSTRYYDGKFLPKVIEAITWREAARAMVPVRISNEVMRSRFDEPQTDSELNEYTFKWRSINDQTDPESIPFYKDPSFQNLMQLIDFESVDCLTE